MHTSGITENRTQMPLLNQTSVVEELLIFFAVVYSSKTDDGRTRWYTPYINERNTFL